MKYTAKFALALCVGLSANLTVFALPATSFFIKHAPSCEAPLLALREEYNGEDTGTSKQLGKARVTYLSAVQREANAIYIDESGLLRTSDGSLFSSDIHDSIFVVDLNGNFYVSNDSFEGVFHHSSLVAGESVWMAGKIRIANGRVVEVTNASGHYKPGVTSLLLFLNWLKQSGVKLEGSSVSITGVDKKNRARVKTDFSSRFGIEPRHVHFREPLGIVMDQHFMARGEAFF